MSDSPEQPWSNHPNAPQISTSVYRAEKELLAGYLIGAISYGIVVALFFQCTAVLLNPSNPTKQSIKWALIAHTVAMFSFITTPIGIVLNSVIVGYINNREYPGNGGLFPPGPLGYSYLPTTHAIYAVYSTMFPLNQWLADGLLLHRCYVIYSMNHWAMAFPYLLYLASIVMGIARAYEETSLETIDTSAAINVATSYYSVCLGLNLLLTLMIVTRLVLHRNNIRKALGASEGASGLYKSIATMIIESYAIYAVTLLLYTVPWAIGNWADGIFSNLLGTTQVIAPYLIIIRVAKRRALTSESISGSLESIQFRSQGSADIDGSPPDGSPASAMGVSGEAPGELSARDEDAIEELPL